jgi:hypothetical protein
MRRVWKAGLAASALATVVSGGPAQGKATYGTEREIEGYTLSHADALRKALNGQDAREGAEADAVDGVLYLRLLNGQRYACDLVAFPADNVTYDCHPVDGDGR